MTHDPQSHDHSHAGHDPVDCAAAFDQLFDFLDGELDAAREAELEAHMTRCKPCFEVAEFERRFLEALHAAREEEKCPKALRERVLGTLRAEGLRA